MYNYLISKLILIYIKLILLCNMTRFYIKLYITSEGHRTIIDPL